MRGSVAHARGGGGHVPRAGREAGGRQRPRHESPLPPARLCLLSRGGSSTTDSSGPAARGPALPAPGARSHAPCARRLRSTQENPPCPPAPDPHLYFSPLFFFSFLEKTHPETFGSLSPSPSRRWEEHHPRLPHRPGLLRRLGVPERSPQLGSEGRGAAGSRAKKVQAASLWSWRPGSGKGEKDGGWGIRQSPSPPPPLGPLPPPSPAPGTRYLPSGPG